MHLVATTKLVYVGEIEFGGEHLIVKDARPLGVAIYNQTIPAFRRLARYGPTSETRIGLKITDPIYLQTSIVTFILDLDKTNWRRHI